MDNTELKSRIEAVLFTTAKALQVKEIANILETPPDEVEEALLELIMDYASRDGALEIDDENGYILQVKFEHMDIVEKLCPVELKPAVLKTLTVIALKEPIRLSFLKEIRGGNTYEHVQELVQKGLISKNKDKNGRSFNIKTTSKFAEYFKLKGDAKTLAKVLEIEKGVKDEVKEINAENAEAEINV
jgi:segregation and condensation protein B